MDNSVFLIIGISCMLIYSAAAADGFTEKERIALEQFRPKVINSIPKGRDSSPSFLLRWLKAGNFNQENAASMIVEYERWRDANKIDTIVNETILQFDPPLYSLQGYDYSGRPLLIVTPTHIDLRKLIVQGHRDKSVRFFYQILEKARIAVRDAPFNQLGNGTAKNITNVVTILDLHGYSLRHHACISCVGVVLEWFKSLETYYPLYLAHFIVINVPKLAIPGFNWLKPILSPATQAVLRLFPPDKRQWSEYLRQLVPEDQLPFNFGGTKGRSR